MMWGGIKRVGGCQFVCMVRREIEVALVRKAAYVA